MVRLDVLKQVYVERVEFGPPRASHSTVRAVSAIFGVHTAVAQYSYGEGGPAPASA